MLAKNAAVGEICYIYNKYIYNNIYEDIEALNFGNKKVMMLNVYDIQL